MSTVHLGVDKMFNINGINLAARVWGKEDRPPVLALHGWLDNAASFERIAPYLQDCFVVAPDLAGHGLSDHRRSDSHYYLWEYAFDTNQLVKFLGWKSFSIIAHSMGTGVASILSSLNKDIVTIIFLDGMGAPFTIDLAKTVDHFKRSNHLADMALRSGLYRFSKASSARFKSIEEAVLERRNGVGGLLTLEAARLLASRDLRKIGEHYDWRHDSRLALPEPMQLTNEQASAFVRQINCPLYLMLGRSGLFVEKYENRKNDLPPSVETHWFDGGHHFHLDCPTDNLRLRLASIISSRFSTQYQSALLI